MKKVVLTAVAVALVGSIALAYNQTVGTNSVTLLVGKPAFKKASTWTASTVYAQADVVKYSGNYYMAVAAGTSSTNAPVHTPATEPDGEASDGAVTWRFIAPGRRSGWYVTMRSATGKADISFASSASVATNGFLLKNEGHSIVFTKPDDYQGFVTAISTDTNDVVLSFGEF